MNGLNASVTIRSSWRSGLGLDVAYRVELAAARAM